MARTFLQAEWRKLAMANYSVDKKMLTPFLPYKTELDEWNGACYISLVGFMFLDTRVKGFRIPFHVNFEEVNLRFYVRYYDRTEWKRGVAFIKEIVPKRALTFVANTVYKENYETMPMANTRHASANDLAVQYKWKKRKWNSLSITADNTPGATLPGSEEEFITEHYWGYTRIKANTTSNIKWSIPGGTCIQRGIIRLM